MSTDREIFLRARLVGIGGSDVAHVFDEKPYHCSRQLGYEKLSTPPDFPDEAIENEWMEKGSVYEQDVIDAYLEVSGRRALPLANPYVNEHYPFIRANLDGLLVRPDRPDPGTLEVKCHDDWFYEKVVKHGLRAAHLRQIHHNMFASGTQWGTFVVAKFGSLAVRATARAHGRPMPPLRMVHFDVERDDDFIGGMLPFVQLFWQQHERGELSDPLPNERDERCRRCIYRRTCRGSRATVARGPIADVEPFDSEQLATALEEYRFQKSELTVAEQNYEDAKGKVIVALEGRTAIVRNDGGKIYHRPVSRTSWDSKGLELVPPLLRVPIDQLPEAVRVLTAQGIAASELDLKALYRRTDPEGGGVPLKIFEKGKK